MARGKRPQVKARQRRPAAAGWETFAPRFDTPVTAVTPVSRHDWGVVDEFAPPPGSRCAAYVAVDGGLPVFRTSSEQRLAIRAYADRYDLAIVDYGCDIVSGDEPFATRPGALELLVAARTGSFTHVLVDDLGRVGLLAEAGVPSGLIVHAVEPFRRDGIARVDSGSI